MCAHARARGRAHSFSIAGRAGSAQSRPGRARDRSDARPRGCIVEVSGGNAMLRFSATIRSRRSQLAAASLTMTIVAIAGVPLGCAGTKTSPGVQESAVTSCPVGSKLVCESGCDPPPCVKPICYCVSKDEACIGQPNGTACDDFDPCTHAASCQSAVCVGASPVMCSASDECHQAGVCNRLTGQCSNPAVPDGSACSGGTCSGGVCLGEINIFDAAGAPLFGANVPTDTTFAYATHNGDLGSAGGLGRTIRFVPGSFPPGQRLVAYDFPYGTGPFDEGGSDAVSDVLAGHWVCLPTAFTSLMAPHGASVTASNVDTYHLVRYVGGNCRVRVPLAPFFHQAEAQIVSTIDQ